VSLKKKEGIKGAQGTWGREKAELVGTGLKREERGR
jgi:hypothetical protein